MINLKKITKISLIILFNFIFILSFTVVRAEEDLIRYSRNAIVIECDTGDVLFEKNPDENRYPASTTKIMTIKLVLDALKDGIIRKDQVLTTSEYAASMGGSQIFLSPSEQMTVEDLLKAVVIASANDAAVVLAEAISGTESLFVKKMNDEAARLKMTNTNYKNVTGLHDKEHYSSARDLAIISRELILKYENEIIPLSSTYEDYLRKDTDSPFWLVNTNKLIKSKYNIDGLKTGWTNEAGYCLVATKKENNMRVITVVMGADTPTNRNDDVVRLFNYAYATYEKLLISPKGSIVKTEENLLYNPSVYNIVLSQDIARIIKKSSNEGIITYELIIEKDINNGYYGTKIGKMKVYVDDKLYQEVDVELKDNVKKSSFIELFLTILDSIL